MKHYYDAWESETPTNREKWIRSKLIEYVEHAKLNSPFYKNRLSGFEPNGKHPLAQIPILTSDLLREELPPKSTQLLTKETSGYTVFQSGGTTGFPKTTLFSGEEMAGLHLPNSRGFHAVGLTPKDRVANLFAVGGLYMTFIHIHQMLETFGCTNFPFSNHTPPDFIYSIVKQFKINCFTGISSVVLDCLRKFPEIDAKDIHIDKIYYGGEHLYEADRLEIQNKFGSHVQIFAPGYGTVDTWYIGYQCSECAPGVFHAHDDQTYIEIVDEAQGEHCEGERAGMLYATSFPRRLTPVVRYRVGDRAKWIESPCPCGRTTPLFQLLGRGDDVLRIGFDSIDYTFIQTSVLKIKGLLGSVQIEKKRISGKDELVIRVEADSIQRDNEMLQKKLSATILEARPSLREFIDHGTVWPLKIEILNAGSLPKNPRTGKLVRVIDSL